MGNPLEDELVVPRVSALPGRSQVAFAAFWTTALAPPYERLAARADVRPAEAFRPYLDMIWDAALGHPPTHETVDRAQHYLVHAAPEIDVYPILGYAGMEYTAALWDALETIHGESRAIRCRQAFADVLYDFLVKRDLPNLTPFASDNGDPFGLTTDPLWSGPTHATERLLTTLELEGLPSDGAEVLRADARILGESVASEFARVADERRGAGA